VLLLLLLLAAAAAVCRLAAKEAQQREFIPEPLCETFWLCCHLCHKVRQLNEPHL
jgi:hypothetical protein